MQPTLNQRSLSPGTTGRPARRQGARPRLRHTRPCPRPRRRARWRGGCSRTRTGQTAPPRTQPAPTAAPRSPSAPRCARCLELSRVQHVARYTGPTFRPAAPARDVAAGEARDVGSLWAGHAHHVDVLQNIPAVNIFCGNNCLLCSCLLSLGGPLQPEQRYIVNERGVVKIRMYSDVRNGELLKNMNVNSPNGKWKQFDTCLVGQRLRCGGDIVFSYPDFENVSDAWHKRNAENK